MGYLVTCPGCGHAIDRHDHDACRAQCGCRLSRAAALEAALERVRVVGKPSPMLPAPG